MLKGLVGFMAFAGNQDGIVPLRSREGRRNRLLPIEDNVELITSRWEPSLDVVGDVAGIFVARVI